MLTTTHFQQRILFHCLCFAIADTLTNSILCVNFESTIYYFVKTDKQTIVWYTIEVVNL